VQQANQFFKDENMTSEQRLFTAKQREALLIADAGLCAVCGEPVTVDEAKVAYRFHAGHAVAHSKGGATDYTNGQVEHAHCNQKHGDKTVKRKQKRLPPIKAKEITPRDWQRDFVNLVEATLDAGGQAINANATVGSGKTFAALLAHASLSGRWARPLLIVMAPRDNLLEGWKKSASDLGMTALSGLTVDNVALVEQGRAHVLLMTYQGLRFNVDTVMALCSRFDVSIARDEAQWLSDDNSWGTLFEQCTSMARFTYGLTGTPFRTIEGSKLTGFEYDDDAVVVDYTYDYHDALRDQVCPRLEWEAVNATIQWQENVDEEPQYFSEALNADDGQQAKRLRYGCLARENFVSPYVVSMVNRGVDALTAKQRTVRDAGGVLFVDSMEAAKVCSDYINTHTEHTAAYVTCDAKHGLKQFKKSGIDWIVAVEMLKEGTDLPRLGVAVFCSSKPTDRQVIQMTGRLLRLFPDQPWEAQSVLSIVPADQRYLSVMREFGVELNSKPAGSEGESEGTGGGQVDRVLITVDVADIEVIERSAITRAPEKPVNDYSALLQAINAQPSSDLVDSLSVLDSYIAKGLLKLDSVTALVHYRQLRAKWSSTIRHTDPVAAFDALVWHRDQRVRELCAGIAPGGDIRI
jgi:superfamily II DNA or RNA helicase